jgi:hypothetical protein
MFNSVMEKLERMFLDKEEKIMDKRRKENQKQMLINIEKLESKGVPYYKVMNEILIGDIFSIIYLDGKRVAMVFTTLPKYTMVWDKRTIPQMAEIFNKLKEDIGAQ